MENPTHSRRRSRFLVLERQVQEPTLTTVADVPFWSYANLAMAERAVYDKSADYQKLHFIIRNRLWSGLRRGTMHPGSALKDHRTKLNRGRLCAYCGSQRDIALDHLIPKARKGRELADNAVCACRSCNSSKGSVDVLEWFKKRGKFPPLFVLRIYLKEAIRYCIEHDLLSGKLNNIPPYSFRIYRRG